MKKRINGFDSNTLSNEAVQNIASVYNKDNLTYYKY